MCDGASGLHSELKAEAHLLPAGLKQPSSARQTRCAGSCRQPLYLWAFGARRDLMPLRNSSAASERSLQSSRRKASRNMCALPYVVARSAPIVATVVVIVTLAACVGIAKTKDEYLGGLGWPYFSDVGRDMPGYAVFCTGLSIVAISLVLTWSANYQFQLQLVGKEAGDDVGDRYAASIKTYIRIVRILGVLSAVGLPVLAFFSTTSYPDVHQYAAYWFFVLEAVALLLNTITSYKLSRLVQARAAPATYSSESGIPTESDSFNPWDSATSGTKRTFYLQAGCATLFFIAFVLYIPVGLAIIEPFERLTVQECLDRDLGEDYCNVTMRYSALETKLWNYENDLTANQIRSASQLACILTLVGYSMSFLSHDSDSLQDDTA